ncbi:hypothetical protein VPH35_133689 [Triticum aestivum]|uniref:uncharacterized protein n=1 Tax=Triticum aestivum TaxID=4565 RepID=UPI0008447622|nr:uncharacterized protein LOC123162293 [Triticum aestivum]
MIRRRDTSPLEVNDILGEILLRLPPHPSSLPRASAVCKRWRGLLTDPGFFRRFCKHHREPPLLGVFRCDDQTEFTPVLAAPDLIPPVRLHLPNRDLCGRLLGCRHGRVLILNQIKTAVLVCDPITGGQHRVPIPPEFKWGYIYGAVLCAASDQGHVHGGCHSTPFKVVLLLMHNNHSRPLASVYSSVTNTWGCLISTKVQYPDCFGTCISTLVGNIIYWSFPNMKEGILGFDFERQILDVLEGPPSMYRSHNHQIIQADDGAVGLAMLFYDDQNIQMWERKVNCHGVASWVQWKTIELHKILGLPPQVVGEKSSSEFIRGHVEDTDKIFLYVKGSIYLVHLKSMQSRKLFEAPNSIAYYHSFRSFYAPGARELVSLTGAVDRSSSCCSAWLH